MSNDKLEQVKAERDSLAAHVERIASLANGYGTPLSKIIPALGKILADTPSHSLARRDLLMKAEALMEFVTWSESMDIAEDVEAFMLSRQSEQADTAEEE